MAIDEKEYRKRQELEKYANREDEDEGRNPWQKLVNSHKMQTRVQMEENEKKSKAEQVKKVLDMMCETDALTQSHRHSAGFEPEDIFRETSYHPQIYAHIDRVAEIFDMQLQKYLNLEDTAAQPEYRKWRSSRQAAKERIGMIREENEARERMAAEKALQAMADIFKQGLGAGMESSIDRYSGTLSKLSQRSVSGSFADQKQDPSKRLEAIRMSETIKRERKKEQKKEIKEIIIEKIS